MIKKLLDKLLRPVAAIEFRNDSLVLACLNPGILRIKLLAYTTIPFIDGKEDDAVSEIKQFFSKHQFNPAKAFVCIPPNRSIIKFIDIPAPSEDRLKDIFLYEIEKHVPFQPDDIYSDFSVLSRKENMYRVLLTAIQKNRVDSILSFLKKIPLQPQSISISPLCLLNAIAASGSSRSRLKELFGSSKKTGIFGTKSQACVSLFLRHNVSDAAVFKDGSCVLLKDMLLPLDDTQDFFQKLSAELNDELPRLSIDKLDRILLSWAGASNQEIPRTIADRLDVKVITVNPVSAFVRNSKNEMQDACAALGASLTEPNPDSILINLLPPKLRHSRRLIGQLITKILLALTAFFTLSLVASGLLKEKLSLISFESKLKENAPAMAEVEKITRELQQLKKQTAFLSDFRNEGTSKLNLLAEITKILPADTWLTSLEFKEPEKKDAQHNNELILSGFAASASKLIPILEESPVLENVEFIAPVTKTTGKEGFKIKALQTKPAKASSGKDTASKT